MVAKKKGAGGNLTRSQVVTVRLDPKLRYLGELAALRQRRTLSSYIEWAVQESLKRVHLSDDNDYENTVHNEADRLWDVDEPDRFMKLAFHYPELLTYAEQIKWKLICENGYLWRGKMKDGIWTWEVEEESFILERLRKHWERFCAVAEGDEDAMMLPTWKGEIKEDPILKPIQSEDISF
ncbi:MAG: hypothetical protein U9R20_05290 [Thermodesulfobacteriota bacterium]|nr:hypothetical protein [Thermodesulfobacteriota bacterium]